MQNEFTPTMSEQETALLAEIIPKNACALEFGSGGSTQFFFEHEARYLVSIDSDKSWLEKIAKNPVISTYFKYNRWLPLYTDIGQVKKWGRPASDQREVAWLNYHQYCWEHFSERAFDIVLIDGRFRVACLCQSLLRCKHEKIMFAFHDFWTRPHYHVVLHFLDLIEKEDSLGVFKPKSSIDWRQLGIVLQQHLFQYE